jgi:fused signal recognition particle receptor
MLGKLWTKIKAGLAKTRSLFSGVAELFHLKGRVDQKFLQELEKRLYLADVGTVATTEIVSEVRQAFQDKEITGDVKTFVMNKLKALLSGPSEGIRFVSGPTVVMVAGVNGQEPARQRPGERGP